MSRPMRSDFLGGLASGADASVTLDQAVARVGEIQGQLDRGELTVPHPEPIRQELGTLLEIFAGACKTTEQARALTRRITAATPALPILERAVKAELPW